MTYILAIVLIIFAVAIVSAHLRIDYLEKYLREIMVIVTKGKS